MTNTTHVPAQPLTFLSLTEVANYLGLAPVTLRNYSRLKQLPPPDAMIGKTRGWTIHTIDKWNQSRPGQGHRSDLDQIAGIKTR